MARETKKQKRKRTPDALPTLNDFNEEYCIHAWKRVDVGVNACFPFRKRRLYFPLQT